jgi:branched-chain amino acid transport system permease protein
MTCIFAMLALSLDIIMGYMGQFSFGHQAYFGIGAYTSALLSLRLGVPVWLGFLAAAAVAAIAGFLIGCVALRTTRGFALAIVTLGFGVVLWVISRGWYDFTDGMKGLTGIPPPVISIPGVLEVEFRSPFSYYFLALTLLALTIYIIKGMLRSRFGRALIAIRENEGLATAIGIAPFRYYLLAFTLAAALAGLSGAAYGHYLRFVNPMLLGMYYIFIMLIMVLVGGSGTLEGPIIGAVIFVWVPELTRISEELRLLLFGAILVFCIILMPQGIYPYLSSRWKRIIMQKT